MKVLYYGLPYFKMPDSADIHFASMFKKMPFGVRFLRKLYLETNLPKSIWLNIPKNINEYDIIIVIDQYRKCTRSIEAVCKSTTRLILYYWNPIKEGHLHSLSERWEVWTFDFKDSRKYNMKYNSSYYVKEKLNEKGIKYDVFFAGIEKDRLSALINLKREFDDLSLKTFFYIVSYKKLNSDIITRNKNLSYCQILELIGKSKAILEIQQSGQNGMTLRTLESLFYERKLITTNKFIVRYPFYNKNNIFILEEDSNSRLHEFINLPYVKIDDSITAKYTFDAWLERIIENTEFEY